MHANNPAPLAYPYTFNPNPTSNSNPNPILQRYKGTLLVRFDDTNPSKEKEEFEDNIIQVRAWLGLAWLGLA